MCPYCSQPLRSQFYTECPQAKSSYVTAQLTVRSDMTCLYYKMFYYSSTKSKDATLNLKKMEQKKSSSFDFFFIFSDFKYITQLFGVVHFKHQHICTQLFVC